MFDENQFVCDFFKCQSTNYLSVSDGDDVGGDVSGHVTGLGLDDGEGGERSASESLGHLGGALEETRVKVEDVTGESLTTCVKMICYKLIRLD